MEIEIQAYLTEFGNLRRQIREVVRGLDDEAASYQSLPEGTNSIYGILSHLIGSQNHWVRKVISGEAVERDREAEFRASGRISDLVGRWEKVCLETEATLGKLGLAQLAEIRTVSGHPEWGIITVRWCVLHLISHFAVHLGHIQLTRQLWEQRHR